MKPNRSTFSRGLRRDLVRIVGKENALFDWEDRICYAYDALNRSFLPDAVLFPGSVQEVSRILSHANERGFFVVPRGAGSGFSGGSVPVKGGVVLSMDRLSRILGIDDEQRTAVVEPGVVTGVLQKEADRRGLFYPPDPSSLDFCTLGGNVSECAGGPRAMKYGVTKDYVEALEVVLPTGEIVFLERCSPTGRLLDLMVGSEGTLGIVTRIHLRLLPLPKSKATMLVAFSGWKEAAQGVLELSARKVLPSALEFLDATAIQSIRSISDTEIPPDAQSLLIVEVDGDPCSVQIQVERIQEWVQKGDVLRFRLANRPEEAEGIWRMRRAVSPSLLRLKPHKINEDVAVPLGKLPSVLDRISNISRETGILIANFGHAGDGNIHVNLLFDRGIPGEEERAQRAAEEIFHTVLDQGGTLSGEHGIGISKAPFLTLETGETGLHALKAVKFAFDPHAVLNPGKIFPDLEPEGCSRT